MNTTATPAATIPSTQVFGAHTVTVVTGRHGTRGLKIVGGRFGSGNIVPLDLVPMLADRKDQFLKEVIVACGDCKNPTKAGSLECDMCPSCYEAAGEENAAMDAGEDE